MYQLHTKRSSTSLLMAVVLVGSLAMTSAQAGKKPNVDICHLDAEAGIYEPISVNRNSLDKHVENHGDQLPHEDQLDGRPTLDEDCFVIAPPHVFVRAFIDVNENQTYDGALDVQIATVEDTNGDLVPSAGDTVKFYQYPLNFDPCPAPGNICTDIRLFGVSSVAVTNIAPVPDPTSEILINSSPNSDHSISFRIWSSEGCAGICAEELQFGVLMAGEDQCRLQDWQPGFLFEQDHIELYPACQGSPADTRQSTSRGASNDYFLEIEFYPIL
jgi:hypothetical protein